MGPVSRERAGRASVRPLPQRQQGGVRCTQGPGFTGHSGLDREIGHQDPADQDLYPVRRPVEMPRRWQRGAIGRLTAEAMVVRSPAERQDDRSRFSAACFPRTPHLGIGAESGQRAITGFPSPRRFLGEPQRFRAGRQRADIGVRASHPTTTSMRVWGPRSPTGRGMSTRRPEASTS